MVNLWMWTMIEVLTAVASACLLVMRPLIALVIPRFISEAMSRRNRSSGRNAPTPGSGPLARSGGMRSGGGAPFDGSRKSVGAAEVVRLDTVGSGGGSRSGSLSSGPKRKVLSVVRPYGDTFMSLDEEDEKDDIDTIGVAHGSGHGTPKEADVESGRDGGESLNNASTRELFRKE